MRPPTMTVRTSPAAAANTTAAAAWSGSVPANRGRIQRNGGEVGERADGDRTGIAASRGCELRRRSPPSAAHRVDGCPGRGWPIVGSARSPGSPRTGRRSRGSRCRSSSRCRAARRSAVGPMPSARSRSVVGQMHTVEPAARRTSRCPSAVRWVAWMAVNRSPSAPSRAAVRSACTPYAATHCSFSAGCSLTWAWSGGVGRGGPRGTVAIAVGVDASAPNESRRRAAPSVDRPACRRPVPPSQSAVPSAEPALRRAQHRVGRHAGLQVAGVEQRDPYARPPWRHRRARGSSRWGRRTARRRDRGGGSGTRRRWCIRPAPSRQRQPSPARDTSLGRDDRPAHTSVSRHVQNVPIPPCVRPRRPRWKAWLWPLTMPGRVSPCNRTLAGRRQRPASPRP